MTVGSQALEDRLPNRPYRALPGVVEVLRLLDDVPGITVGLVTGNIVDGARLKLASAGIDIPLTVGAFGSDHEARNQLPGIAMTRANQHLGVRFSPDSVLVVGDTPRDIECGKHHGTRTLGVATGSFSEGELRVAGADVVLPDLSSTGEVVEILSLRRSA